MSITQDQLVEHLSNMTVLDLAALRDVLEDKWGVSAAAPVMMAGGAGPAAAAEVEEQTEFTVSLDSFGAKKIGVIKEIRSIVSLGLKEAKELVESAPCVVKEGIPKAEAEEIKAKLEGAGATASIK